MHTAYVYIIGGATNSFRKMANYEAYELSSKGNEVSY